MQGDQSMRLDATEPCVSCFSYYGLQGAFLLASACLELDDDNEGGAEGPTWLVDTSFHPGEEATTHRDTKIACTGTKYNSV